MVAKTTAKVRFFISLVKAMEVNYFTVTCFETSFWVDYGLIKLGVGDLGPISRKSRNFTGHLRVIHFPRYLKNGEDLSRQTSQTCFF